MSGDGQEKTHDATPRKLAEARRQGDVPVSREGSAAGAAAAALFAVMMLGGPTARRIGELMLPLIDQPEAFTDFTPEGLTAAGRAVFTALAIGLAPVFGLLIAAAILPHLLGNSVAFSTARLMPKLANLSPSRGIRKVIGIRPLVEFAKNMVKLIVVAASCWAVARPLYANSVALIGLDLHALGPLVGADVTALLGTATLIAAVIAGVDVPFQHWSYRRRQRMSLEELKDEARNTEGNPHVKARLRKLRMQRAQRRMMHDVPKASVIITNPTHYAVALRYERGQDAAPVVVAKGLDLVAQNIKELGRKHGVPLMENRPLARALHASVEIGQVIPREHFEAVAKIIGLIWAQKAGPTR